MKRFAQIVGIGFLASISICAALTVVWYAMALLSQIPAVRSSFVARGIWLYSALLYPLYALSIPAGQVCSFCFFRRRHQRGV